VLKGRGLVYSIMAVFFVASPAQQALGIDGEGAPIAEPASRVGVGLGGGLMYSGLGANATWTNAKFVTFVSAGCIAYSLGDDGSACGVGAGRLWRVGASSDKHSIGGYAGLVDAGRDKDAESDLRAVYGVGLLYVYFPAGLHDGGLSLGLAPVLGFDHGTTRADLMFQIGYQFP